MAKKKSGGNVFVALVIGVVVLVANVPRPVWIAIGIASAVLCVIYLVTRAKKSAPVLQAQPTTVPRSAPVAAAPLAKAYRIIKSSERPHVKAAKRYDPVLETPVLVSAPASDSHSVQAPLQYDLPKALKGHGPAMWLSADEPLQIADAAIRGGLIYVGRTLKTAAGAPDPCLINPALKVGTTGDFTQRNDMGYWPSYSDISPAARRAYLNWLATGRDDPRADIGYVFLFFYGLERRAIVDSPKDAQAAAERPAIAGELRRLLSVYADKSPSFRRYASELLSWVSMAEVSSTLYADPVPEFPRTMELPFFVRLALGQAAVDRAPVPMSLALAWAKLDPACRLRTPAIRCAEQFDLVFAQKYTESFGQGIVLPLNRTKLRFVYSAASSALRNVNITLNFGDTPDVSVLTGPIRKIQEVVEAATKALEPYSRYVGKDASSRTALEGLLQLPATLWPADAQQAFTTLKARMGEGMIAMSFQALLTTLDAQSILTRDKTLALARALESINIGIEPDVLSGAKLPKPEEKVVLFYVPPGEAASRVTPAYLAATLTLDLAASVAMADGEFSASEMSLLRGQIQSWSHLTPNHLRRLLAHLRLLMIAPPSLASLKKKLEPLDVTARDSIATFMASLAQVDGLVSPDEVKMLEKVYKALGVEPKRVFTDVHAAAAGADKVSGAATAAAHQPGSFKLDLDRIAALQKDTEKVSALLAGIFREEESVAFEQASASDTSDVDSELTGSTADFLGLDATHAALARLLLSRPEWTRAELQDAAADLDVLLDGALERINEASFDTHDIPFTEGDDPIVINTELMEKIEA